MKRLLILGGTGDAAKLAGAASKLTDLEVIYSLAGRTRNPNLPDCKIRIGGFGGVDGLAAYLEDSKIDMVIDATHPFAATMASHAADACNKANVARVKFGRAAWVPDSIDWISVSDYKGAVDHLKNLGDRVFLSIGTKDLGAFSSLTDKWYLIRAVEKPEAPIPLTNHDLLLERGPFDDAHERTILVTTQIDVLVSKNSGGAMAAKLQAANDLGIPIVMIEQPEPPEGEVLTTLDHTLGWIEVRLT